jgi:PilZ domain
MPWLSEIKRAIQKLGEPEKPRAERRPINGITALYGRDSASAPAGIKDISVTGIYLYTDERPAVGELVTIILCVDGEPEKTAELQFSLQARVATHGEDGIGLSFVLPPGVDSGLWGVLMRNIAALTDPHQVAETFRTVRTILFLCRLCHADAEEAIGLFGGQLDVEHTANLFKIVFAAESQLSTKPDVSRMRVHPKLVTNILREGAWAADEAILKLWTDLLVSSCTVDEPDDSNQIFVDLLVHITSTEGRIFNHACKQALDLAGTEGPAPGSVVLSPKEMAQVTGVHDPYRNATDLAYLFNLGLVQKVFDFSSYQDVDTFDITPTKLGLELYKHCHGSREKVTPEMVEVARAHLANFLPAPHPDAAGDASQPLQRYSADS